MNLMTDIQDIYEMTPMQAGMLFQSLYAPEAGAYYQQYWGRLEGPLDGAAFRASWQGVIDRHDILRAQCHWQDLDRPALAIHAGARPEWQVEDWSAIPEHAQQARLDAWLAQDRARGIDPASVPLMRFALIRMAADRHVFVWGFHHLLLDGWCGALVVREVMAIHGGAEPGPAPRPFADYVDWLARQDRDAARYYWKAALAGVEPTPLGIDRPETGQAGYAGHRFRLGADATAQLMALARRERLTLASLMQGAWALVLSRYAGQADVCFGTVLSGRPADLPGVERMLGLFLQTVPVRVALPGDAAIWPWLRGIQAEQRLREAHGHVPLSDIQGWAGQAGSTPLIDSLLIVETYPESIETATREGADQLRLVATGVDERTNFPLTIKVLPGDEIEICLTADTARIPAEALPRLAGHLACALAGFAQDGFGQDGAVLDGIDILTPSERAVLRGIGQGPQPPVPALTLARIMRVDPSRPAVESPGGDVLSYGDLLARSGVIGAALRDRGVGRGDIVAVCQDRGPDLLATLIAVWRCGAAYLPIDPIYPAERIAYILDDAGAVLAVVDEAGRGALAGRPVLDVAECRGDGPVPGGNEPDAKAPDGNQPGDIAYILYTSGSTGRPKGVPIQHGALANFLASTGRTPGVCADDRWLALTTVAFDIAALELFGPLVAGATVVLAPTGAGLDGGALGRMIGDHRISVMQATPAGWRVLRDSGWQGQPGLRMLSGGEALDSALARDLMRLGGALWNLYGPTETTIWSAALPVEPHHLAGPKLPVGGPLDHTTLSLRDQQGRLAPVGVPGELWIGGAGLSPGYLHRPDLTAERFVTRDGETLYRTGDRMRWNPDGTLDFLGRFDDQVKLRGYRIELGEIEAQLETHPAIGQAVAMVRGEGNAARLVAYLRCDGPVPKPAELRAHLGAVLPAYMIPSAYVGMTRFPLTPNGKIDRKALPAPDAAGRADVVDRSQRDEVVAGIWAGVLGVAQVGPDDDFFALGGHSLLAMRVIGELRQHLGVEPTLRDLFEAPVLERFCARIGRSGVSLPPVVPGAGAVLSPAQHRQWLLNRLDPDSADYHLPLAVRLSGALDPLRLERALLALARRHDVLRSRFPDDRGAARVEILPEPVLDLRRDDHPVGPDALDRLCRAEAEAPFDLGAAPPWRARLVRLSDSDHVLLLTLHHILADEWSFGVMLDELRALYLDEAGPAPAIQYPDFAAWQGGLVLDAQRDYWCRTLDGAPAVIALPADRPRPARRDGRVGRVSLRVDAATAEALENLARQNGATLFICLLAAYALFLHRHGADEDVVIGTPVSNRRLPEFQNLIGLFVNTLAIRAGVAGAGDFAEMLRRVRETVLAAHENQDLPFEQVLELLSPPRSESHAPLVQTMFSMQALPREGALAPGLDWQALPRRQGRARFDLALELTRTDAGIEGHFDYAADIFDDATAMRLARRFEVLLRGLAADLSLAELPLLTDADRAQAVPAVARVDAPGWLADPAPDGAEGLLAILRAGHVAVPDGQGWRVLTGADDMRAVPAWPAPGGAGVVLGRDPAVVHGLGLLAHLSLLAHAENRVSTGAALSEPAGLAALAIALRCGVDLALDGPADGILVDGRLLRFGPLGSDADVVGLPEFPAAFVTEGGLRPAGGVRAVLLDRDGLPVPPGVPGLLALGGVGLARGYAGAPGRTAARFLPNPLSGPRDFDPAQGCLFHTGLRMRLDGDVLVPAPLPETPRLRAGMAVQGPVRSEAAAGAVEIALARIWAEVLEVPPPGRHDGFFDLGGDSILAVQVAARATGAGLAIEPRDLFRHQTLAALALVARPVAAPTAVAMDLGEIDLDSIAGMVSFGDE